MQNPTATTEHSFAIPSLPSYPNRSSAANKSRQSIQGKRRNDRQSLLLHLEEIVEIQEILHSLSAPNIESDVRFDFTYGIGGAPKLSENDLENIAKFHRLITSCKRPQTVNEFIINIPDSAQQLATEHFKLLIEGRHLKPEGFDISYSEGKMVIQRVLKSGYFQMRRNFKMRQNVKEEEKINLPATNPLLNTMLNTTVVNLNMDMANAMGAGNIKTNQIPTRVILGVNPSY